jgi:CDP-paratose 2-epimerase
MKHILITGGCGFIGSNLAAAFRAAGDTVTCLDNLSRAGSEILRDRVVEMGARFVAGDVRHPADLDALGGEYDAMIEASAEPSVLVGTRASEARFVIENNLVGSVNCFEWARARRVPVLFLSTSRVYPYDRLNALPFEETETRFEFRGSRPGVSGGGVGVDFPLDGYRSLYGATKLASELLLKEYSGQYGLPSLINRCGVVAGPWQLGKVDQGVFTYWMVRHFFDKPLAYIGYGGSGRQVRDLLHIDDLVRLVQAQLKRIGDFRGEVFNVGGSRVAHLSLRETTELCRRLTGHTVTVAADPNPRPADVTWYITDNGATESVFGWKPEKTAGTILADIHDWLRAVGPRFRPVFGV